jgi:AcrR family transcriptional regulator
MPRPARFSREQLVSVAVGLAAAGGPTAVTMQGLAAAARAPSGSVYHRFAGRPELLAEVWVAAVERFQRDWWAAVEAEPDPGAAAAATVGWAREHRELARILTLHHAGEFLGGDAPAALVRRVRASRAEAVARLAVLSARWLGGTSREALERTTFALATVPLAALRGPLARGEPIGEHAERLVRQAAAALIARRHP